MSGHEYSCHVRFSDVDAYGHVNNVKYFEYYQEARVAFLTDLRSEEESGLALVVARMDVDYKRPILFRPDPYVVRSRVLRVGRSSFVLAAAILDGDGNGEDSRSLLSRSEAVMVAFDLGSQRSRPWSKDERVALEAASR